MSSMRKPSEVLHHSGVGLRRWRVEDAGAILGLVTGASEHLVPWMPWASGYTAEQAEEFAVRSQTEWGSGEAFNYAVIAPGGRIAGSASMMARIGPGGLEIGYWLHPEFVGRGLVRRAVSALVDEAFRIGADRVEIVHDVANVRSGAVPKALGFTEVERRSPRKPLTPGETGLDVVWRRLAPGSAPLPGGSGADHSRRRSRSESEKD